jgi:hypothetical protein
MVNATSVLQARNYRIFILDNDCPIRRPLAPKMFQLIHQVAQFLEFIRHDSNHRRRAANCPVKQRMGCRWIPSV